MGVGGVFLPEQGQSLLKAGLRLVEGRRVGLHQNCRQIGVDRGPLSRGVLRPRQRGHGGPGVGQGLLPLPRFQRGYGHVVVKPAQPVIGLQPFGQIDLLHLAVEGQRLLGLAVRPEHGGDVQHRGHSGQSAGDIVLLQQLAGLVHVGPGPVETAGGAPVAHQLVDQGEPGLPVPLLPGLLVGALQQSHGLSAFARGEQSVRAL